MVLTKLCVTCPLTCTYALVKKKKQIITWIFSKHTNTRGSRENPYHHTWKLTIYKNQFNYVTVVNSRLN